MKDKFKFRLSEKLNYDAYHDITKDTYVALRHPEDSNLFVVMYPWEYNAEGWGATIYSVKDIQNNFDDGSWILIKESENE